MSGAATVTEPAPRRAASRDAQAARPDLRRLADALDAVCRLCPSLPVAVIRWMALRHPLHPRQEQLLRGEHGRASGAASLAGLIVRCVAYAVYFSARLLALRAVMWRELAALKRQRFELIARTCCFGAQVSASGRDFYYGDLQPRLAQRGVRMLLLCGDVTEGSWLAFAKRQMSASPERLPELCLVPPLAPLQMAWQQLVSCWRLRSGLRRLSDPLVREAARLAARECLLPDTALTGLIFWIAKQATRTWHPRAFMTAYEGQPWERCGWWGAKAGDPACRTIGYQHTAIFEESLAMTLPLGDHRERTTPDVALCLGESSMALMRAGHARYATRLIRFGSFRHAGTAAQRPADPARQTILVTPEGIGSEVEALFTFALACARRMPTSTFILRCHPQLPMSQALRLVPEISRQPNLVLSEDRPIEADFARASVLLYRGSSTVMYAILHGLRPFYVPVNALSDRDPLYAMAGWRQRSATPEETAALLERDERMPEAERTAEWAAAARYVREYTGPVSDDRIEALLDAVGLKGTAA